MIADLMDPADNDALRRRVVSVRACVDSLSGMLTQLLDYNRLELGLYSVNRQKVDLDHLMRETAESFGVPAEDKGLEVRIDSVPVHVATDPSLLRRMLSNLLANAIRYTPRGSVALQCFVREGNACIAVQDTGVGIAADRIGDIFMEYVRLPGERNEREEGFGLGLSIVSKGADLLGHEISVESTLGKGSRFVLDLGPALRAEPQAVTAAPAAMPAVPVAVIENDPVALESLMETLTSWGCEPVGAREFAQLELELRRNAVQPALLVCDLHLSHTLSGLEAIERLRRQHSMTLPAILLTGDLDPSLEQQARAVGVELVHKPVRPARLREIVLAALGSTRAVPPVRKLIRKAAA